MPDESFDSEEQVLEYLVNHADVTELVQSISSSGWLDYEPLIVLDGDNTVLEGNRRLAALRIISDKDLRDRLGIDLPDTRTEAALPDVVRIRRVASRAEARDFIGFKHINGPFKWDALAKAKYAAEWLGEGGDIKQISRRLGDNHNTVSRLVSGWNVLNQSLARGFKKEETTKRSFPFSHLYTALARPTVRRYLGLPADDTTEVLMKNPVPEEKVKHLQKLMSWLYGQKNEPTIIMSQNPDLNRFIEVLGNEGALSMLEADRDLNRAYDRIEDKERKFSQLLWLTIKHAEDALKLVPGYDGGAELLAAGENLGATVRALRDAMRAAHDRAKRGGDDDAS